MRAPGGGRTAQRVWGHAMRALWRRWLQRNGEEISPWVGLSFGALYLGAVAAVGIAAFQVQQSALTEERLRSARAGARWLSRYLAQADADDAGTVGHTVRSAARDAGTTFCAIVSPDGVITAHSDPTMIGRRAEKIRWLDPEELDVRAGVSPDRPDETILAARMVSVSPSGKATLQQLRIGLAARHVPWGQSKLLFWSGYVLLAVLGLYLLAYRLLRRAVQPLAVIRRRLIGYGEPTAEGLLALRLNDSFDQISTSWNRLIDFVSEMQDQLRRSRLVTDVGGAMDGYRSERLTEILMQIPFGVLVVDANRTISFANRAAVGMLGTPGEPLVNTPADAIFDDSLQMVLLSPERAERRGPSPASRWTDHSFKRAHGDVMLRFWSIPSAKGGEEHVLFVQDVTQAKEAERARDVFLYHITHELRTPLTNIRAYAETLSHGVIDDEQTIRECYNVIMGETQRLGRLIEDILNVSQLEVGSARLDIGEVHVDQLVRKVVQDMQAEADAKHIDLLLNLPAKMPRVRGDKERLAVVLNNLIGNAIKYTPEAGRVDVRCAPEDGRLRIAVSDTGIGIDPADQEKIFEKFFRVDAKEVAALPGTGLGLAIVKETVRLHGGSVGVESTPGKGTTFTVVLPAMAVDESETRAGAHGSLPGENR